MWLTENPWPPVVILVAVAVLFVLLWQRNKRVALLAPGLVCLLLIPVVFLVEEAIVTPAEEIEARILAVREAVIREDVEGTLEYFSETAVRERAAVALALAAGRVHDDARVTDLSVQVKAGGTLATSHFRANGTFTGRGMLASTGDRHFATRWRASWRKEGGEWKIYELERLNVISGEPIGYMSGE